jgi:acyl dehydratase
MVNVNEPKNKELLYLDDLRVGQRFLSGTHRIDEARITAFAQQFDPQPFHLDAEAAKETLFAGLAASGWHTAAISMRLVVESVPIRGGIVGAGGELAWPTPTRSGATLHVESEILELQPSRSHPDRGIATVRSETV